MGRRENLSLIGLVCYHPDRRRVRLAVGHVVGAYSTARLIPVLQRLPRLVDGDPVILVWDNAGAHHSRQMTAWLAGQTSWLQAVWPPGYAPDLNPVEGLWSALMKAL
jgi:hypothetical protein